MADLNGKWRWIAGSAGAVLLMAGSGAGSVAWSAYEKHDLALERHGEAIARLVVLAEVQQETLKRITTALERLERN